VQILATGSFLIVLAGLLLVRAWIPPTFEKIDPDKMIANRYKKAVKSSMMAAEKSPQYFD
jgi:hypothetical protein